MASFAARRRGLLLVILLFVALVGSHLDVIPFWDAKAYLYCVEEAVQKPFDVLNFRCAGAFAVAVIFSKETGAVACAVATAAYVIAFVLAPRTSWAQRIATLRSLAPLAVAPLAPLAYLMWVAPSRHDPLGWPNSYAPVGIVTNRVEIFLNTNLADPGIRSFLTDIFVLNYQWL